MERIRIAVYGQYKTGTTGLFAAIRRAMPASTRSLFEVEAYLPEAADAERAVLAKVILGLPAPGWAVDYESFRDFDRHVYIVRDPRDWVVSGLLFVVQQERAIWNDDARLAEVLGLLRSKERNPSSLSFSSLLSRVLELGPGRSLEEITDWMSQQLRWLVAFEQGLSGSLRIRYEDYVDGRLDPLKQYLGFPVRIEPVPAEHDHVARTCAHGDWRNWFLAEDVLRFRPVFREYMEHYGYQDDWAPSPRPLVQPAHASRYVERAVMKRRVAHRSS